MISKYVVSIAAVLVALVAQPSSQSLQAAPVAVVPSTGTSFGSWQLPTAQVPLGELHGVLVGSSGATLFKVDGTILEDSSQALAVRLGSFIADLDNGSTAVWPKLRLYGNWTAVSLTNIGVFDAQMTVQFSPLSAVFPLGAMKGQFSNLPTFPVPQHRYTATWRANL